MTNRKFAKLFGAPRRKPESEITQREMDIAASIQVVTEKIVMMLANTVQKELGVDNLCLAGGVALNCVANGKLLREGPFKNIWIQPSAGDAGGALGAALVGWHDYHGKERKVNPEDSMTGAYLGPKFLNPDIEKELKKLGANYEFLEDSKLFPKLAEVLDNGDVLGWHSGRMEFGPRALGGRSIIGDPRNQKMQSVMNLKIKYRESFRPFAPVVIEEDVSDYFEHSGKSPYMLIVAPVKENIRKQMSEDEKNLFGIEKLNIPRSEIPAVTHVDYSARIQTVGRKFNPRFRRLMEAFKERTGCSVLVNTSFNVRGEPIVCDVKDAFTCFMRTEMDWLVLENCVLSKKDQNPELLEKMKDPSWKSEFELD
jgi:carbamoyltransferase